MKKSIIIGIIIFISIIILAILAIVLITDRVMTEEKNNIVNELYNEYLNDIDSAVNELMSSQEYNKMNKDKQVKVMGELLDIYERKSVIKNLYFDEFGPSYTFTYNYGDIKGALGGVMLKKWDPMMN